MLSLCLCRSGEAWRLGSAEPMSRQERTANPRISLDQSDEVGTVWKYQWGRRGGPWTDPWGPDFKALYRGDGMLLLSVPDGRELYHTRTFSQWQRMIVFRHQVYRKSTSFLPNFYLPQMHWHMQK